MKKDLIEGFQGIADHVTKRTGLSFSIDAAQRAARRAEHALPVTRFGRGGRARVVADVAAIDEWILGEWRDAGTSDSSSQPSGDPSGGDRG